jgi:simple sugar transport system permease protein
VEGPERHRPANLPELADAAKLPYIGTTAVHVGFVFALVATAVVWVVLRTPHGASN